MLSIVSCLSERQHRFAVRLCRRHQPGSISVPLDAWFPAALRVAREHDVTTTTAGAEAEFSDARVPVETAECRVVFVRMTEGRAIGGINRGHAIISPAV